jgi:hypothetical protein
MWQITDLAFLVLAALAGTVFMIAYTRRTQWWRKKINDPNWEHRAHLGYFTLTLTLMLWIYVFRAVIPMPTFVIVRRVFFDAVSLLMVWRVALLFRSNRRRRRARQ